MSIFETLCVFQGGERPVSVMVQINTSGEENKNGLGKFLCGQIKNVLFKRNISLFKNAN